MTTPRAAFTPEDTVMIGVTRGVRATHYVDANVTPSAGTVS